MPNFEKPPIPSFENDDFDYKKEKPALEKKEAEEEELEEAVEAQGEELKEEAEIKSKRFKGAGGFLGKAAIAIASIFGGREVKADEPPLPPEKPAAGYKVPEYKIPEFKVDGPSYGSGVFKSGSKQGPVLGEGKIAGERQQGKGEMIVTSKSLADMLGASRVRDLGEGKFAVYYRAKNKYIEVGPECLEKIAELQAKYNYHYGRSRFKMRADAMKDMRADMKAVVEREGLEVEIEEGAPEVYKAKDIEPVKKTVKKEAIKKTTKTSKSDYEKDAGAYDRFDK